METRTSRIKVLIAAKEREIRDQIRREIVAEEGQVEIAGTATDGLEAVQMAVQARPDIAILKDNLPIFNGMRASEFLSLAAPEVRTLLISEHRPDTEALLEAMRAGIREWVVYPSHDSSLIKAVSRIGSMESIRQSSEYLTATDPRNLPKLIVVSGGKGGVGKTTIATSLAAYLAQVHPGKVVLVDMYTQFGDVGLMMDITPSRTLVDLAPVADEIDQEIMEAYLVPHPTGVKVLIGSSHPEPLDAISPACAENVIHTLKSSYTHIVVDLPPILHPTTLYLLSHAYKIVLVTTLFDLPSVHDSKQLHNTIAGNYVPVEKILLVANRASKTNSIKTSDLEAVFGRKVDAVLPNDNQLILSINRGESFVNAYSHSPLSEAIASLVRNNLEPECSGEDNGDTTPTGRKGFNLWSRRVQL
jgi:pilus assembly protein CpaE